MITWVFPKKHSSRKLYFFAGRKRAGSPQKDSSYYLRRRRYIRGLRPRAPRNAKAGGFAPLAPPSVHAVRVQHRAIKAVCIVRNNRIKVRQICLTFRATISRRARGERRLRREPLRPKGALCEPLLNGELPASCQMLEHMTHDRYM